jgi:hypothetical protein
VIEYPQGDQTGYEGYCIRPGKRSQDYRFCFFLPVYEAGGQHDKGMAMVTHVRYQKALTMNLTSLIEESVELADGSVMGALPLKRLSWTKLGKALSVLIIRP